MEHALELLLSVLILTGSGFGLAFAITVRNQRKQARDAEERMLLLISQLDAELCRNHYAHQYGTPFMGRIRPFTLNQLFGTTPATRTSPDARQVNEVEDILRRWFRGEV